MLFRTLSMTLALVVVSQDARAFGAMDCVGSEFCMADGCSPSFMVFGITFDWTAQSATIGSSGETTDLDLASNDVTADGTAGALVYLNEDNAGMILDFAGDDITMTFYSGDGSSHIAACSAREAA